MPLKQVVHHQLLTCMSMFIVDFDMIYVSHLASEQPVTDQKKHVLRMLVRHPESTSRSPSLFLAYPFSSGIGLNRLDMP